MPRRRRPLVPERGHRIGKAALAVGSKPDRDRTPAVGLQLALNEPALLAAQDELRNRALAELEPLFQLGEAGTLGACLAGLDHQQQLVGPGSHAVGARDLVAAALEAA